MKIHLLQYTPAWENKAANKEKISQLLNTLKDNDTEDTPRLVILPEMTLTGFTMNSPAFAEDFNGNSTMFYKEKTAEYNVFIAAGIIEYSKDAFYNTLLIISPSGEITGSYRKIHPFSYSDENKYYSRGEQPVIVNIGDWKTGLTICYDLRFPELYRHYGKQRAELLINIANWPVTRIEHWKVLLRARAIENQCYVAGVNRTGSGNKLQYNGFSALFDPMGSEIIMADESEGLFSAQIDKETVNTVRQKFPFLDDIHLI